jgi:hypothetical protein
VRRQHGCDASRGLHRARILVGPAHLESEPEQRREVAASAAAGVEHAHRRRQLTPEQLIEEIDVDAPEGRLEFGECDHASVADRR